MSHTKRIQAFLIKTGVALTESHPELGVYADSVLGSCQAGLPFIWLNNVNPDILKFYVGQQITISAGFVVPTCGYFTITLITGEPLVIIVNGGLEATSTQSNITIAVESEIRWSENLLSGLTAAKGPNTPLVWTAGIIAKNGIGPIKETADLARGGSPTAFLGLTITAIDTNQLLLRLNELGIKLPGLSCEIWEYSGTEAASDNTEVVRLFSGICGDCTWSETVLQIPVENNVYKRRAQMGTVINNDPVSGNYPLAAADKNGQIVPISFGEFRPRSGTGPNVYAKFERVAEWDTINTIEDSTGKIIAGLNTNDIGGGAYCDPQGADIFPIVGVIGVSPYFPPYLTIRIKMGTAPHGSWPPATNYYSGKYIKIISGSLSSAAQAAGYNNPSSCVNKFRKIASSCVDPSDDTIIDITLESYFDKDIYAPSDGHAQPIGNYTWIDTAPTTWLAIVDMPFQYVSDVWPCIGFEDQDGATLSGSGKIYAFNSGNKQLQQTPAAANQVLDLTGDAQIVTLQPVNPVPKGFVLLPPYGFQIGPLPGQTDIKNAFIFDLKQFKDDPSKIGTFDIFPCANLEKYIAANLGLLITPDRVNLSSPATDNLYSNDSVSTFLSSYFGVSPNLASNISNLDAASYCAIDYATNHSGGGPQEAWAAYQFDLPLDKLLIEYSSYYLGVMLTSQFSNGLGPQNIDEIGMKEFRFSWARFWGNSNPLSTLQLSMGQHYYDGLIGALSTSGYMKNIPDFYFKQNIPSTNNVNFYYNQDYPLEGHWYWGYQGYSSFEFDGISSIDNMKSISKMFMVIGKAMGLGGGNIEMHQTINLYKLALICELDSDISQALYSIWAGRIFNDTWGARKTAANLMSSPIDIFEHVCRLQNWSEVGDLVVYGKQYCPNAKIKTSGAGSFDDSGLAAVKALSPVFQITDEKDGWTDRLKEALCKRFFLISRQDSDGNECLHYLDPQLTDASTPDTLFPSRIFSARSATQLSRFIQCVCRAVCKLFLQFRH